MGQISDRSDRRVTDGRHGFDGHPVVLDPEAATRKNVFVDFSVQLGEAVREFKVFTTGHDRTKGAFTLGSFFGRHIIHIQRQVDVTSPLFPGYLFVRFDLSDLRWTAINSTRGVAQLIALKKSTPAAVPEPVMQAIMERCDATGLLKPPTDLKKGDKVGIKTGPFAGAVAAIETLPDQARIGVLIDLLGRRTKALIPRDQVEKIR